jgi:hypothetical protein
MGNKGWLSKEDLRQKILKQYLGDISVSYSSLTPTPCDIEELTSSANILSFSSVSY